MPDPFTFDLRFEGEAELLANLEEMGESTQRGVLRRVAVKALQPVDVAWRALVHKRTGKLQKSGGVGTKLSRGQKALVERENQVEVCVGPGPLVQAIQEEFGNRHQAPHPSMRPAWDGNVERVADGVVNGLGEEIGKTQARVEARAARQRAKYGL